MDFGTLIADLHHSNGLKRARAAAALGQINNSAVIPALLQALKDENPTVRSNATFSLGELGANEASSQLISMLDDSDQFRNNFV